MELDIHQFNKKLIQAQELVKKAHISEKNKELILGYDRMRGLEGLTEGARSRITRDILRIAKIAQKDFSGMTRADIESIVMQLDTDPDLGVWSRTRLKGAFKRFFKWVRYGDDYTSHEGFPDEVRWVKAAIKKKDIPLINPSELLTEEEIKKLIDAAENPRDKAFVSVISESGARISEIGNLHIKDVYQDEFSYLIHLKGKTGERTDRVVYSDIYLAQWINIHPLKSDPDAPLWINLRGPKKGKPLKYSAYLGMLKKLFQRAGVNKPCHPHIFRHSRVTINLSAGKMTEAEAKAYFGWEPDSKMLSIYSHLTTAEANKRVLQMHGLLTESTKQSPLEPKTCPVCHTGNSPTAQFCEKCARPLDLKTSLQYNQEKNKAYKILNAVMDDEFLEFLEKKMREKRIYA